MERLLKVNKVTDPEAFEKHVISIIKDEMAEAQRRINARFLKNVRRRLHVAALTQEELEFVARCHAKAFDELNGVEASNEQ